MALIDDVTVLEQNAAGCALLRQGQTLRQQEADTNTEKAALEIQIQAEVSLNNFVTADFERHCELTRLLAAITTQKANVKSQIQSLRPLIAAYNMTYHDELLTEENLL